MRMFKRGLQAPARRGGWSALALSAVSGVAAIVLVLTTGASSVTAARGLTLSKPGATAVTHFRLSANVTPSVSPPTLPPNTSARQGLINAQSDLGKQLSLATWSSQSSTVTVALNAVSALDNTHVWAVGAGCTLLFSANGTTWTKDTHIPGGCSTNLTGVFAQDNSHAWAVGSGGVVLICSAGCNTSTATWSALGAGGPGTGVTFAGVWGNGNTVYAVGSQTSPAGGVIWVCSANCTGATVGNGAGKATWAGLAFAGSPFAAVTAVGPGNPAYVVGATGAVRLCKTASCTTTGAWLSVGSFGAANFTSVTAVDANHVYAVGANGGGVIWACSAACNNTVVGTGSGQAQWVNVTPSAPSPVPAALTGVTAAGGPGGSAWAVGAGGAIWFCGQNCSTLPTQWVLESPNFPTTSNLAGVGASDANHAWAVGAGGGIFGMVQAGPPDDAIAQSLQGLGNALDPALWAGADGNHVDPTKFQQVFDQAKSAESPLNTIKPTPPSWASNDVLLIEGAMRLLATTEMSDNACSPQKAKELDSAQKELDAGDQEWSKGHPDQANDHYKNAYDHANRAHGVPCAGLSVAPLGSLFTVTSMVPGDSDPTPNPGDPDSVKVTVLNSPGTVTLSTANVLGALSGVLTIKVQEFGVNSTNPILYNSSLSGFPATLALPGNSGTTWGTNESHFFQITVGLPVGTGNGFQNANSTFDLNWTRS